MDDNEVPAPGPAFKIRQRNAAVPARRAPPPVTDIFSGKATVIVKREKKAAPVVKDYTSDSTIEIVAENLRPKVLMKDVKSKQKPIPKRSDAKAQNDRVKAVKIDRCVFPP